MKNRFVRFVAICLCFTSFGVVAQAQDETLAAAAGDRYVISAKAGGVNYVEGAVGVVRKSGKSGALLKGDTLRIGDRVSTGADGKAEILLNPGSFLRLGGNSAFEFKTTILDDLQLRLYKGSAILEVFAAEEFKVAVNTPNAKHLLIATGVYRIDVLSGGEARLEVWKGLARVGQSSEIVKGGRVASTTLAGGVSISKFDRDDKDPLDIWSKARGKELAKSTARLKRDNMRTALMRSFVGRGWNTFNSFGLWVWDPFGSGYCFLPFGRGWYSPYGYGYGNYLGWYNLPHVIWYPPHTSSGGSGGPNTPVNPQTSPIRPRGPIPPFLRMQQTMGGGTRGGGDLSGSSYDAGSGSSPSYSPPPSSSQAPAPPFSLGTGKGPTKQP